MNHGVFTQQEKSWAGVAGARDVERCPSRRGEDAARDADAGCGQGTGMQTRGPGAHSASRGNGPRTGSRRRAGRKGGVTGRKGWGKLLKSRMSAILMF